MALELLIMLALLQMGASVPAPEPDPHNIVVQVKQDVDIHSGCCNGVCPCGHKDNFFPWNKDCCWVDNEPWAWPYRNGSFRQLECVELQCVNGNWTVYEIDPECGNCTFGGEPLVYTFDPLKNTIPNPSGQGIVNPVITSRLISVNLEGEFVMTQPGHSYGGGGRGPAAFGVNGHFSSANTWDSDSCGGWGFTDCVDGLIYYEKDIAVKLEVVPGGTIKVYWNTGYLAWSTPSSISTPGTWQSRGIGGLFVFKATKIPGGGRGCTIVIGSMGLTVALCKEASWFVDGYPWSFIYASPSLQSLTAYPPTIPPTAPTSNRLYGLCNSFTIETEQIPKCFYEQPFGDCVDNWQCGNTHDHNGGPVADIRTLCNTAAVTWERP